MSVASLAVKGSAKAWRRLVSGATEGSIAFLRASGRSGLKSLSHLKDLAKNDKVRFISALVAYGLIDEGFEEVFDALASEDSELTEDIAEARDEVYRYAKAAGVDLTPEEDEKIANIPEANIEVAVGMYTTAKRYYDEAARAVGGRHRLLALMHWLAVDDDLKQMVINHDDSN